jgi:GWxTD domain-containing protein
MNSRAGSHSVRTCSWLFLFVVLAIQAFAGIKPSQLPKYYREWLEKDVVYIINNDERQTFLNLATDAERDKFIERFWELRNPDPGAPINGYKEEHYRRLEYVNAHFGRLDGSDGWRTDRGRTYITLGPPKQTNRQLALNNMWPLEIWFYSNGHPALPPHFYVVFYQKEGSGEFRLYSPYMDGPDKLVSTLAENDRAGAYRRIREVAGPEIARNSLTLLTDEPVDADSATSSLQSDVLLSNIKNLPNLPISKDLLRQRNRNLETVRSRLILGDEFLRVFTVPLRDNEGNINLHYLLSLNRPEDFAVGKQGEQFFYNVTTEVVISDVDGKEIFKRVSPMVRYLSNAEFEAIKGSTFGIEGWIPIAPGKYKLKFLVTNKVNNTVFKVERDAAVPGLPTSGYFLTSVIGFRAVEQVGTKSSYLPFSFAGIKFTPLAPEDLDVRPGEDLNFFYQIWSPQGSKPGNLKATYTYGRLSDREGVKTLNDEFSSEQFDAAGSMINGKKLPTSALEAGNYRMSIAVIDPATNQRSFSSAAFRVGGQASQRYWRLYDETVNEEIAKGNIDFDRGRVYQAAKEDEQALTYYRLALKRNPENHNARARLADLLFARKQYPDVVSLFSTMPLDKEDGEAAVVQYAESLNQVGEGTKAISVLESALKWGANSKPVYLSLADCYRRAGNVAKANDLLKQSETAVVR